MRTAPRRTGTSSRPCSPKASCRWSSCAPTTSTRPSTKSRPHPRPRYYRSPSPGPGEPATSPCETPRAIMSASSRDRTGTTPRWPLTERLPLGVWLPSSGPRRTDVARIRRVDGRVGLMDGFVHPDFHGIARLFGRQLRRTTGGAAVAVYFQGELVVDLWGGRRTEDEPWQRDTLAMCFSTTKGAASAALHLLADQGQIDYDAPVAAYWPQFAQGGKERITVRHVLTHSAGLHRMRTLIDHASRMLDWEYMVAALERAEPAYEPGSRHGYHALTYGWLAGELVRRVAGRPIAQFVEEELARPLGLDGLYVGCPPVHRGRVAPLAPKASPLAAGWACSR